MRAFETRKTCSCAYLIWSSTLAFRHNSLDIMYAQDRRISDAFSFYNFLPWTTGYRQQPKGLKNLTIKSKSRKKRIQDANVLSCIEGSEKFSPITNRLLWDTVFLGMIFLWLFKIKDYITHEPLLIFNSPFALFSRVYCLRIKKQMNYRDYFHCSSNNSWSTRIVYISISIDCFYVLCSFLPHHSKDFWELFSDLKMKMKCSV